MKNVVLVCFLIFAITAYSQNTDKKNAEIKRSEILEKRYASFELKKALNETSDRKIITGEKKEILNDSTSAIKAAEKFLFKTYGKKIIEAQKPYKVYLIDGYWIIWGSYIDNKAFLIILNKENSNILKHRMRELDE